MAPLLIRLFSPDTAESGPARNPVVKAEGPGIAPGPSTLLAVVLLYFR
jgi:hypothetical protein